MSTGRACRALGRIVRAVFVVGLHGTGGVNLRSTLPAHSGLQSIPVNSLLRALPLVLLLWVAVPSFAAPPVRAPALPTGLNAGDDIEWSGTLWARTGYSARQIAREVRLRRLKARQPKGALTAAQIKAAMRAVARAYPEP